MAITKASTSSINTFAKYNKTSATAAGGLTPPETPGIWVAVARSNTTCYSSTDGTTWTARTLPAIDGGDQGWANLFTLQDGRLLYPGEFNDNYTSDGINWNYVSSPFQSARLEGQAQFSDYGFVNRCGYAGNSSSTGFLDAGGSIIGPLSASYSNMHCAKLGDRLFISSNGSNQTVHYSDDEGYTWTEVIVQSGSSNQGQLTSLATDGETLAVHFSGVTSSYGVWKSTNSGINWTKTLTTSSSIWTKLRYVNGYWIVLNSSNGQIQYSTDATNWTNVVVTGLAAEVMDIDYGNGKWVACDYAGEISTSSDIGSGWAQTLSSSTSFLSAVKYY